jgi:hypothetical protein
VMVNAFLNSVYGQPRRNDVEELLKRTARYRKRSISSSMPATEILPRGAAALLCGSLTAVGTPPAKRVLPSCRACSFTPIAPRVEELPRRPALAGRSRTRALS